MFCSFLEKFEDPPLHSPAHSDNSLLKRKGEKMFEGFSRLTNHIVNIRRSMKFKRLVNLVLESAHFRSRTLKRRP